MRNKFLTFVITILLSFFTLYAGNLDRVGTTSGVQLLIPVGGRSIGMGGASLGLVSGAEAIYWNPAGISAYPKSEFMFNNMQYIADIDLNYLAISYNGGRIGAFGFHIKSLNFGDLEVTTEDKPDGTGETYSPSFIVAGLSYSRALTDRITAGVTGKMIYEGVMETSASAVAIDLGAQYSLNANLKLGVVMKNVGTKMQYDGRNMERNFRFPSNNLNTDDGTFRATALQSDIPSTFSFGATYVANINEENSLVVNATFSNYNESSDQVFGGLEYAFRDFFFLRGGYNYEAQVDFDDQIFGAAFGAGMKLPVGNFEFTLDYAFRQLTDYFDSNNIFTIKLAY